MNGLWHLARYSAAPRMIGDLFRSGCVDSSLRASTHVFQGDAE
jgi:hypothetical protein